MSNFKLVHISGYIPPFIHHDKSEVGEEMLKIYGILNGPLSGLKLDWMMAVPKHKEHGIFFTVTGAEAVPIPFLGRVMKAAVAVGGLITEAYYFDMEDMGIPNGGKVDLKGGE